MGLTYDNLDSTSREYMIQELDLDITNERLYISPHLNSTGQERWPVLLREAVSSNNDDWLAQHLRDLNCLNLHLTKNYSSGRTTMVTMPVNAYETLAEGEFNRFYMRGLCSRAIAEGISEVEVYRGKMVARPQIESESPIGRMFPALRILKDLRANIGLETIMGIPGGPNSGITVRLPR